MMVKDGHILYEIKKITLRAGKGAACSRSKGQNKGLMPGVTAWDQIMEIDRANLCKESSNQSSEHLFPVQNVRTGSFQAKW